MYDIRNKTRNIHNMNGYMLAKTLGMFSYTGLPETIPAKALEKILQGHGFAFVADVGGELYALSGGLGGVPDPYGEPTQINVTNPALNLTRTYEFGEGVLVCNDSMRMGIYPLMDQYHTLLTENTINMDMLAFNSRNPATFSASDAKTQESAERYIKKLREGETAVIGDNAMFDGVKRHAGGDSGTTSITELIEYNQYLKAALLGELGINAPFNMKRERVNSGEVDQHEEALSIFVDDMKAQRDHALEKINAMFGTNIACEFAGVWREKRNGQENAENPTDPESGNNGDPEPEEVDPAADPDADPGEDPEAFEVADDEDPGEGPEADPGEDPQDDSVPEMHKLTFEVVDDEDD